MNNLELLKQLAASCKQLGVADISLTFDDFKKELDVVFDIKEKYPDANQGEYYDIFGIHIKTTAKK